MTQRRHLKELIRARMARTNESYTTARLQLSHRARAEVRGGPTVIVPVSDISRAADFYCSAFGLAVRSSSSTWTVLGDGDESIALEPGGTTGVDLGIGLIVGDLASTLDAVAGSGGGIESRHEFSARVVDPDGNVIRVMATARTAP